MGYFSNGSEGGNYEGSLCTHCIHYSYGKGCPVLTLHMHWNYEQFSQCKRADDPIEKLATSKALALSTFIPRSDKGFNEKCKMYVPVSESVRQFFQREGEYEDREDTTLRFQDKRQGILALLDERRGRGKQ